MTHCCRVPAGKEQSLMTRFRVHRLCGPIIIDQAFPYHLPEAMLSGSPPTVHYYPDTPWRSHIACRAPDVNWT